jgi:hypothetical protein
MNNHRCLFQGLIDAHPNQTPVTCCHGKKLTIETARAVLGLKELTPEELKEIKQRLNARAKEFKGE